MPDESLSAVDALVPPTAGPGSGASPVFVLTASRSGSTLLRFILDSHPRLACPPETNIAAACAQMCLAWDTLEKADSETRPLTDPVVADPEALAAVREYAARVYDRYLARRGKSRWCDKSLDNFQYTDLIAQLFPDARFICLYRHCMDVIASAVEACPWGLHRFGLDGFVAQNAGNSVAAVGSYWQSTVGAIQAFEERHPQVCHRVRYEDLVTAPEETAAAIFSFLGEQAAPGITEQCFDLPHEGNGSGDEKLWFTSGVSADSMGRGFTVPADALPEPLRRAINETLGRLGYRPVDEHWNSAPGAIDPRITPEPAPDTAAPDDLAEPAASDEIKATATAIAARIAAAGADREAQVIRAWPGLAGQTIRIVVANSARDHQTLTWTVPGAGAKPAGPALTSIMASAATWQSLLANRTNAVTELTAGRLRCINSRDRHRIRSDEMHAFAWLLGLARTPLTRDQAPGNGAGNGHAPLAAAGSREPVPA